MSGVSRAPLTLMYHRVNTLRPDPWTVCVSPEHFEQHLEVIRSLPAGAIITFDDGYADNFENAKPLLETYDLPAMIFVTSGAAGSPYEMWWDELDRRFLAHTPHDWDWGGADPDPGARHYREGFARAREGSWQPYTERPFARPERRMMTHAEIAEIAAGGLIRIGAHTVTHPVLARLPRERQRWEIEQSKRDLEEITGRSITEFAYPNGFPADYTAETVQLVKDAGFERAYAAWDGPLSNPPDPYQIPRIMVRDWDGDELARRLTRDLLSSAL